MAPDLRHKLRDVAGASVEGPSSTTFESPFWVGLSRPTEISLTTASWRISSIARRRANFLEGGFLFPICPPVSAQTQASNLPWSPTLPVLRFPAAQTGKPAAMPGIAKPEREGETREAPPARRRK